MFKAVVEIPKGCDRRIHLNHQTSQFEDFGPIKDQIPVNDGAMPIDYGFIKGTYNEVDKDEIDALILTDRKLKIGEELEVKPLAILNRQDGDHKVLVKEKGFNKYSSWSQLPLETRELVLKYFSYHYPVKIIVDNNETTEKYLSENVKL